MSERYNPLKIILGGVALYEASQFAFTISARKEIGRRDNWTCQGMDGECVYEKTSGYTASWQDGFMLTAAHYPEQHHLSGKGYNDPNPDNGRILCTLDHAMEEIKRGNDRGAQSILNMGIYHVNHIRENGIKQEYFTVKEIKLFMKGI